MNVKFDSVYLFLSFFSHHKTKQPEKNTFLVCFIIRRHIWVYSGNVDLCVLYSIKMSVDLDKNRNDIINAWKDVVDSKSDTDW